MAKWTVKFRTHKTDDAVRVLANFAQKYSANVTWTATGATVSGTDRLAGCRAAIEAAHVDKLLIPSLYGP